MFQETYQSAHPDLPNVQFTSDFRLAFTSQNSAAAFDPQLITPVALTSKEQQQLKDLHQEMAESWQSLQQAEKHWMAYQHQLAATHFPTNVGKQAVGAILRSRFGRKGRCHKYDRWLREWCSRVPNGTNSAGNSPIVDFNGNIGKKKSDILMRPVKSRTLSLAVLPVFITAKTPMRFIVTSPQPVFKARPTWDVQGPEALGRRLRHTPSTAGFIRLGQFLRLRYNCSHLVSG